ncbi:hypothetical protein AVEN_117744-1 [Araneus ventricosus]|uniref:Uncharacterized protein n=1 Tax=Araneus ventricosus TaxID=182803 RepID=A0A4Y2B9Q8_ARAVE|nr:hypothetical protein AVEN_117744-1 [Araneus ventricosus]
MVILQHCAALTSLGFIESSGALAELHRMGIAPYELKLRQCYWRDQEYDGVAYSETEFNEHRVREAVLHYPTIEELDFDGCCLRSMQCLRNLRNLVFLRIALDGDAEISSVTFNDVLQEIGPQLKHLSFNFDVPMDVSVLLQNCPNLESLRIEGHIFPEFANPAVRLTKLQRLTITFILVNVGRIFSFLSDCNQLTELFLLQAPFFDDQILHQFLKRNSLLNLKVAYLNYCGLTDLGFRELLLNAPQLEKVHIYNSNRNRNIFERVLIETNHKALFNDGLRSEDEFFEKRSFFYACDWD